MSYKQITIRRAVLAVVISLVVIWSVSLSPVLAGTLVPPASGVDGSGDPAPTMKTLDQIPPTWSQRLPADDGLSNGCASSRFSCVMGFQFGPGGQDWNAVLDKETGLVWARTPDSVQRDWDDARRHCLNSELGGRGGWRLPSVHELKSLYASTNPNGNPDLPVGHPFSNVQSAFYWSASTNAGNPADAWSVFFSSGSVGANNKSGVNFVWCVRGGGPLSEY